MQDVTWTGTVKAAGAPPEMTAAVRGTIRRIEDGLWVVGDFAGIGSMRDEGIRVVRSLHCGMGPLASGPRGLRGRHRRPMRPSPVDQGDRFTLTSGGRRNHRRDAARLRTISDLTGPA
jgi:hypothetical protein